MLLYVPLLPPNLLSFLLQILSRNHEPLFRLLGKTSGRDVDKIQQIRDMDYPITEKYGVSVLAGEIGCAEQ
jgi:hypothetical protein